MEQNYLAQAKDLRDASSLPISKFWPWLFRMVGRSPNLRNSLILLSSEYTYYLF